jgi:hypothetical protein
MERKTHTACGLVNILGENISVTSNLDKYHAKPTPIIAAH